MKHFYCNHSLHKTGNHSCPKIRHFFLGFLLWLAATVLSLQPAVSIASSSTAVNQKSSAEYLEALQIANAFLWAWTNRDAEAGLKLMSNRLRAQVKDDAGLRQFIVGLSNPHHQAFEIGSGRKQNAGRYSFQVTVYELYEGEQFGIGYKTTIEVVREGSNWKIDRLPRSSDNQ